MEKSLRSTLSSNCSSNAKLTTIDDIFDESLMEIFCRLPHDIIFRCKCVSKRWCSLLSNPKFFIQYLIHQHSILRNMPEEEELGETNFSLTSNNVLVIAPKVPPLEFWSPEKELSLSFLGPDFVSAKSRSLFEQCVFGCYDGLVLCGKPQQENGIQNFYICNPLTRDWLELPPAPIAIDHGKDLVGFLCDPYHYLEGETVHVNSQRRFMVVCISVSSETKRSFKTQLFSSETGQWTQVVISCPRRFSCTTISAPGVAHDGKLFFKGKTRILAYDPYKDNTVAFVIDFPSDIIEARGGCLGVSCGTLRISEFISKPFGRVPRYCSRVWDLNGFDCETGEGTWEEVQFYYLPDTMRAVLDDTMCRRGGNRMVAFHPYDRDLVYFYFGNKIICSRACTAEHKAVKYEDHTRFGYHPILPLVIPLWLTPIPSLLSPADHS